MNEDSDYYGTAWEYGMLSHSAEWQEYTIKDTKWYMWVEGYKEAEKEDPQDEQDEHTTVSAFDLFLNELSHQRIITASYSSDINCSSAAERIFDICGYGKPYVYQHNESDFPIKEKGYQIYYGIASDYSNPVFIARKTDIEDIAHKIIEVACKHGFEVEWTGLISSCIYLKS